MEVKYTVVGDIGTNCYVLADEVKQVCAVIDPGDEAGKIRDMVEGAGWKPEAILITHGHFDHTGAVEALAKVWPGLPVYIHRADVEGVHPQVCPPLHIDTMKFYDEGDKVSVGDLTVEVLHTPGHSKGSVTLKAGEILFTGDTLFAGSMGRTDFPGGDYEEIMASLKKLGELEGDYHVCPGHMDLSTLERERKSNYYMQEAMGQA